MKNLRIIFKYSLNSFQQALTNPTIFAMFTLTKIIRYGMFAFFLYSLFGNLAVVGEYSRDQILLFYLVFTLIDTTAQLMFRETYRFRPLVVSGNFDMVLVKPFSPLLRVLMGGPDVIDLGILILIVAAMIYVTANLIHPQLASTLFFVLLIINSLLIAAAFHILVLGIGVLTMSVDSLIMIYRDLSSLMRIPVDLFIDPLRSILTFVIPVGIMFTFPAKFLFGLLSWKLVMISFGFGLLTLYLSVKFWHYALTQYQSAGN